MNNIHPEITVLTCCYNASSFIKETIESILAQTYTNFKYLIIDDGSTDETYLILKKYQKTDSRIKIIQKEHSGLTHSLNLGLQEAKSKWIARLDADDIALPQRLEQQFKYSQEHNATLIGGGAIIINEQGFIISRYDYPDNHIQLLNKLEQNKPFFAHSTAFFNKKIISDLGGYNELLIRAQDKDLWFRIAEKYKIACLPYPIIKLRKHNKMISKTDNNTLQVSMAIMATICHYKRMNKEPDPSLNKDQWKHLNSQVDQELKKLIYFKKLSYWNQLRQLWYQLQCPKILKILQLFLYILKHPYILTGILHRIFTHNIAWKLYNSLKKDL